MKSYGTTITVANSTGKLMSLDTLAAPDRGTWNRKPTDIPAGVASAIVFAVKPDVSSKYFPPFDYAHISR